MGDGTQPTGRRTAPAVGRWAVVVLMAMAAGVLAAELLRPVPAAAGTGTAGGGKVFAIAGQITADTYGLYLVDLESGTICLYEYVARERRLWLRAARTFRADVQLDAYNTEPSPAEVSKMVREARRLKDVSGKPEP